MSDTIARRDVVALIEDRIQELAENREGAPDGELARAIAELSEIADRVMGDDALVDVARGVS